MTELHYEPSIPVTSRYAPWKKDEAFQKAYQAIKAYTLVEEVRCWELWDLLGQCRGLGKFAGDIIEVGVWRGGTGCLLAMRAKELKYDCKVYLCDTWSGVPKSEITDKDPVYRGGEHADAGVGALTLLVCAFGLENVVLVQGIFPDSFKGDLPWCRFLHIDVDVYQSAKRTFNAVKPKMAPTGLVVFDDYGFVNCGGVARYVNELKVEGYKVIHNLNGHAIIML